MRRALPILLWTVVAGAQAPPGQEAPAPVSASAPAAGQMKAAPAVADAPAGGLPGIPADAAERLARCAITPPPPLPPLPPGRRPDLLDITTGAVEFALEGSARFDDRLVIRRGDAQLGADSARFDREAGLFSVTGNVDFRDASNWIRGDEASFSLGDEVFRFEGAQFDLFSLPARGSADRLVVERAEKLRLENVAYTSCARGQDDWLLKAGKLTIDRETGMATARDARLEFMGVPILYSPWLTYPATGERKSGLLLPDLGTSSQRGWEVAVPWYLNLAPNYDATLTPRYMNKRGLQAQGEFRYLTGNSRGTMRGEFLRDDQVTRDNRALVGWFNQTDLPLGMRATVAATDVSDGAYFEDLTTGLENTSQTHLRRRVDLELLSRAWFVLLRLEDYQTLDQTLLPEERPYRRLPQLAASGFWPRGPLGLDYRLDSDVTWFDRNTGVTGLRAHLLPAVALPLDFHGVYLTPRAFLDHTRYSLTDPEPGLPDDPDRTVPGYSVDLGTVLERRWGRGDRLIQTLEPRVQFVYVPFEDQSELPVFDTIEPDFNLVQLFRINRFAGLDRLGDTDQLNIGLTSRLLRTADGSQFLTATLGQSRYFSDRDVVLPGQEPSQASSSDYLAELGLNIADRWNVDLGYQWDSDENVTQLAEARVLYRPDRERAVNLAYRYRRQTLREVDVAAAWPLGRGFSAVGRYKYSLQDNEPLEALVGMEYSACCWGFRVTVRRSLVSRDGDSDTSVTAQLLLKGFGSSGTPAERLLERGILGFDRFDRY